MNLFYGTKYCEIKRDHQKADIIYTIINILFNIFILNTHAHKTIVSIAKMHNI